MPKLTKFKNPIGGTTGDITNPLDWWQLILGGAVMFIVFAMGQQLAKFIAGLVPGVKTSIESPIAKVEEPQGPQVRLYGVKK